MSIDNIKKMYDSLYKSKYDELVRQKESSLKETTNKENQTNLQYQELNDKYNQNRLETQNKYQGLYTGLDNQQAEAKEKYYGDRNTVASQNARQSQQIRDYMAKNNLLQSGENVDAMLRSNTDYSNSMANVYTNEQNTNRSIGDKRNEYKLGEQSAYSSIDNSIAAAERERVQKIQELMAYRTSLEDDFNSKNNSLLSEVEANRIRDINAYNEQIRREQWEAEQQRIAFERQLAAQQASRSYSSGGYSSASSDFTDAQVVSNLKKEVNYLVGTNDYSRMETEGLEAIRKAYNEGYIDSKTYNDLKYTLDTNIKTWKNNQVKQNGGLWGYSTAKR